MKGSVMATGRVVVFGLLLLLSVRVDADQELTLVLSPSVAFSPATVRIRTHFNRNPENRAVQITAESDDFYRSSEVPLNGAASPRTVQLEFRGLPSGDYRVSATLVRAGDQVTMSRELHVVGGDGE